MAEPPQQKGTGKHLAGVLAASPDAEGTWEEPTGDPPQLGASGSSLVSRGCQATSAIAAASQFLQDLTAYRESSCSAQPAVPHVYGRNNHWVQQTPGPAAYDGGGRVPLGQPALQNLRRYIQSSVDRQLLGPGHDLSIPLGNTSGPLLSGAGSAPSLKGGGSMLTDASAADPAEGQLQGMGIAGGKTPKKEGELIKGAWTADEDAILLHHVAAVGDSQWNKIQEMYGLQRSGKSCRLRYKNHLDPSLKKTPLSADEEVLFAHLQRIHGNKWATIASKLPGRTDNELKNLYNTRRKQAERKLAKLQRQPSFASNESSDIVDEAEHSSFTGGDCRPAIAKGEGEWGSGGRPLLRQLSGPHVTGDRAALFRPPGHARALEEGPLLDARFTTSANERPATSHNFSPPPYQWPLSSPQDTDVVRYFLKSPPDSPFSAHSSASSAPSLLSPATANPSPSVDATLIKANVIGQPSLFGSQHPSPLGDSVRRDPPPLWGGYGNELGGAGARRNMGGARQWRNLRQRGWMKSLVGEHVPPPGRLAVHGPPHSLAPHDEAQPPERPRITSLGAMFVVDNLRVKIEDPNDAPPRESFPQEDPRGTRPREKFLLGDPSGRRPEGDVAGPGPADWKVPSSGQKLQGPRPSPHLHSTSDPLAPATSSISPLPGDVGSLADFVYGQPTQVLSPTADFYWRVSDQVKDNFHNAFGWSLSPGFTSDHNPSLGAPLQPDWLEASTCTARLPRLDDYEENLDVLGAEGDVDADVLGLLGGED